MGQDQPSLIYPPAKAAVLAVLYQKCCGSGNALTAAKITEIILEGQPPFRMDREGVYARAAVRELRVLDEEPIGSNSNGYFIIETEEEWAAVIESQEGRRDEQIILVNALRRTRARWLERKAAGPLFVGGGD